MSRGKRAKSGRLKQKRVFVISELDYTGFDLFIESTDRLIVILGMNNIPGSVLWFHMNILLGVVSIVKFYFFLLLKREEEFDVCTGLVNLLLDGGHSLSL